MPRKNFILSLAALLAIAALSGCSASKAPRDRELAQAVRFVHYLVSPRFGNRSAFQIAVKHKTPSAFVAYLFSTMGSAEWVSTGDPFEDEQLRAAGIPVLPRSVILTRRRKPSAEKQLIITGDDDASQIIVEAYLGGAEAPVFVERIAFPRPAP